MTPGALDPRHLHATALTAIREAMQQLLDMVAAAGMQRGFGEMDALLAECPDDDAGRIVSANINVGLGGHVHTSADKWTTPEPSSQG